MADFTVRQNIVLSRITARGSVDEYASVDDANKIVKTDDLGKIHNSLLHDDLLYTLFDRFDITSFTPIEGAGVAENISCGEFGEYTLYSAHGVGQEANFNQKFYIQDDGVTTKEFIILKYRFPQVNAGCYFTVTLSGAANPPETVVIPAADTDWHTDTKVVNALVFDTDDVLTVTLTINGNDGQEVQIEYVQVGFVAGTI